MATSLTTGRPWRVILAFSIPLLLGNVVQQLYQFADAIVVGRHLGVTSLAAVGATGSLLFLLLGFAWGLTSGFAIPIAQAFGGARRCGRAPFGGHGSAPQRHHERDPDGRRTTPRGPRSSRCCRRRPS